MAEVPDLQLIHEDFLSNCNEIDSKILQDALRIPHKDMFSVENCFNGSLRNQDAQTSFVPPQRLSFLSCLFGRASGTMVMEMSPSLYVLLLSLCILIWQKDAEMIVRTTPISSNVLKLLLLFMLSFLFMMQ